MLSTRFQRITSSAVFWCLACIALVTAILYWRRPDAFYNPQLWAEDGNIFFTNAFFARARSLVMPYAGYFHVLARLTAWVGSWLPVRFAPHWYIFASWAILICLVVYIFSARFPYRHSTKFMLGLALVANTADNEVFFNLANWATITTFFWLLLAIAKEPISQRQSVFDIALLIVSSLNSPFVVCLWPLFLFRLWLRRTPHSWRLFLLSLFVVVTQVWNMTYRISTGGVFEGIHTIHANVLLYRFGFIFFGEQIYLLQLTAPSLFFGLVIISMFFGWLVWDGIKQKNWLSLTILGGGVLAWVLSFYVMREQINTMLLWSGRHFFIPAVTIAWALILSNPRQRYLRWTLLSLILVAFLFFTPQHKNQVFTDLSWAKRTARCVGVRPLCRIRINPVEPPVWYAYYMDPRVFKIPIIQNIFPYQFGGQIESLGYKADQSDSTLNLELNWHALERMKTDYQCFVEVINPNEPEKTLVRVDQMPLDGQYPTTMWSIEEIITDQVQLSLETLPPGEYKIGIGWYDPNSPTLDFLVAYTDEHHGEVNRAILPITLVIP